MLQALLQAAWGGPQVNTSLEPLITASAIYQEQRGVTSPSAQDDHAGTVSKRGGAAGRQGKTRGPRPGVNRRVQDPPEGSGLPSGPSSSLSAIPAELPRVLPFEPQLPRPPGSFTSHSLCLECALRAWPLLSLQLTRDCHPQGSPQPASPRL